MRILFRFGDNDFRHTFLEVFNVLLEKYKNNPEANEKLFRDKSNFCELINILSWPIYRVVQDDTFPKYEEERFSSLTELEHHYRSYFLATPDMIYIDKEIDDLIEKYGDGNCAWFVLDTKQFLKEYQVYSM